MPNFSKRSYSKELLDGANISFENIRQNMQELDVINTILGGHRVTLKGVKTLMKHLKSGQMVHIAEIGCGGGDNLRVIKNWAHHNGIIVKLTGVDINPECIRFANHQNCNVGIEFVRSDYREVQFESSPHIIFSSLFCHHFTDDELVFMLGWMKRQTTVGFFINDLHRAAFAYYYIKGFTTMFSKSYLVKNDAPLSVLRSFKKTDWLKLFHHAAIQNYTVQWHWAFRWLVIHAA